MPPAAEVAVSVRDLRCHPPRDAGDKSLDNRKSMKTSDRDNDVGGPEVK